MKHDYPAPTPLPADVPEPPPSTLQALANQYGVPFYAIKFDPRCVDSIKVIDTDIPQRTVVQTQPKAKRRRLARLRHRLWYYGGRTLFWLFVVACLAGYVLVK